MKKEIKIVIGLMLVVVILITAKYVADKQFRGLINDEYEETVEEINALASGEDLIQISGKENDQKRKISVDGLTNIRDLGGYKSSNGKEIRFGKIYRSENLYNVTDEGMKSLEALELDKVIDFRGDDEIEVHPDRMPSSATYIQLPVTNPAELVELIPVEHQQEIRSSFVTGDFERFKEILNEYDINIEEGKLEKYVEFAELWNDEFSGFMHEILESNGKPILFHCEGGKDRTGFAATVFLLTLDVSLEDIKNDFLLTNEYNRENIEPILEKLPVEIHPTVVCDWAHIEAALNYIDENYENFDNYRKKALKISDIEKDALKEIFLD